MTIELGLGLELELSQELKLLLSNPLQGVEGMLDYRQRVVIQTPTMSTEQADTVHRLLGACVVNSPYGLLVNKEGGDPRSLALDLGEMGACIRFPEEISLGGFVQYPPD